MRSHFVLGQSIRDAIIRGDLVAARRSLHDLGDDPGPSGAPPSWVPGIADLRATARDASARETMPEVAIGFAHVVTRCASCHSAVDASIELGPSPRRDVPAQMERHQWAADRMWQGLLVPSSDHYREGATVLADSPLHPLELVVGSSPPLEVVALAERVRLIASRAARASTEAARAAHYGELLSTCADCHSQRRGVSAEIP